MKFTAKAANKTIKGRKSGNYTVQVKLPSSLKEGRYYVRACAQVGKGSAACKFTKRRLTVKKAAPQPAPQPAPNPGTGTPLPQPAPGDVDFDVLAFTKGAAGSTTPAIDALKALGRENGFGVTATEDSASFSAANLAKYKAVVFVNNKGDVLTLEQQGAFEQYYKAGGGFVAIGAAIEAEPDWDFFDELLGTRAATTNTIAPQAQATIKVADRVHDASKNLPEYWKHTDTYYNYAQNIRGLSHVLATVDETTYTGGTMTTLADHPISWCKDYEGGRSFYTGAGANGDFSDANLGKHLTGAIDWAAGLSNPVYSDCGATVLANFKQTKISAPPNLNEPIGFDQLPDGRVIQTARTGEVRLHEANGSEITLGKIPVYTNSEDGLYGPAVDPNFAENKWVYLYYAPPVVDVRKCDGTTVKVTTPTGSAPNFLADDAAACAYQETWSGNFQLSRFKFIDRVGDQQPKIDINSEEKIMTVANNRGACCHVAGDIDFDAQGNLWLVTGDDTPAGAGNANGFSPHNDSVTDEIQTLRVTASPNTSGGTFTLTFNGRTTGDIPFNASPGAVEKALTELPGIGRGNITVWGQYGNTVNATNHLIAFVGKYKGQDVPAVTINTSKLTGTNPGGTVTQPTATSGQMPGLQNAPHADARRGALNTNDLRGKVLRIKVKAGEIADNEENQYGGAYTTPAGNLFAPGDALARPEIYAMGFRNPYRIQVDSKGVAYVTDYSPDSQLPEDFRGPAGTGRVEVVRKPSNYGWPLCYSPDLPYYQWDFNASRPLDQLDPKPFDCDNPNRGPANLSRWNTGRTYSPPITKPDMWYSYRDNNVAQGAIGTPCLAYYDGSGGKCPQLFPDLFTGGVAPHGAAPYEYDADSASITKFPPYYDGSFILGEFGQDQLREVRIDSNNQILKSNQALNCGQALVPTTQPFECDNPEDIQFGADGNLYLLTYGDGFFAANADAGMYKWAYTKGPEAPAAVIAATPTSGIGPLTVQFSSAGSNDPDEGDSIRYAWDFDGNGSVDSIDANPSHIYTANGVYQAKLTVTDSTGRTDTKSLPITVGNTAPTITITTPIDGDFFEWGDKIPYKVTVTDPQEQTIDCSKVVVSFVLIHDTHGHGEDEKTGCEGTLDTLAEDAGHGGYIAGGIVANYTDNGANGQPALSGRAESVVQTRRQDLELSLDVSGTTTVATPANEDNGQGASISAIDAGDWVALNNRFNLTNMDKQITFRYGAGGTAGSPRFKAEVRAGSPTGTLLTTVSFNATGNNNTFSSLTAPLNFTGSQRLYLVFRAADGSNVTSGLGVINWVGFSGTGVGIRP
ncbi:ThuA domain-containing protein [Solirubrobacter phytolaccae]|uniref:ThuA domain-containing protein n=1 Tax=Solirubrobacter phytolaccae TaxID=1404360 RepID=A0A9X3S8Q1_9ACTN|nr:ThuA domain-containing protein [Solirubrobacter phytolaccae]MDA0182479.1 ThuA domain-containing protein [Solirubrobacter phytolaccae]